MKIIIIYVISTVLNTNTTESQLPLVDNEQMMFLRDRLHIGQVSSAPTYIVPRIFHPLPHLTSLEVTTVKRDK